MRKLLFVLALTAFTTFTAYSADITTLRALYHRAHDNEPAARELYNKTANAPETDGLQTGYRGAAEMMMCYHAGNPYTKLKYFKEGKKHLDKAIKTDPQSAELRYLRFAVQCNTPAILSYSNNIKDDKQLLLQYLLTSHNTADQDLYKKIHSFLLNSKECTAKEKEQIGRVK